MQSDAKSSSSGSVMTVYVTPDVWARSMPAGDALPTEMKWSTQDDVRQRRADVVDCCGERERSIREDSAVRRPTRQEVGDCWWEVFRERRHRAPPPQRRRSARPRGTSMGQMGGATRSDDGGRQLGVRAETKGPRGTTTSTGRVGDGAEATRGYQAVAGLTFATKTSGTAGSVSRSMKSVSSMRTSVQTEDVQG